jgi:hypothetical protein
MNRVSYDNPLTDSSADTMPLSVTLNAKRNQIFRRIVAELAPGIQMMDFQHL